MLVFRWITRRLVWGNLFIIKVRIVDQLLKGIVKEKWTNNCKVAKNLIGRKIIKVGILSGDKGMIRGRLARKNLPRLMWKMNWYSLRLRRLVRVVVMKGKTILSCKMRSHLKNKYHLQLLLKMNLTSNKLTKIPHYSQNQTSKPAKSLTIRLLTPPSPTLPPTNPSVPLSQNNFTDHHFHSSSKPTPSAKISHTPPPLLLNSH